MKNLYKHTKTTVSLINYHFVFCPRFLNRGNMNVQPYQYFELLTVGCFSDLALGIGTELRHRRLASTPAVMSPPT